MRVTNYSHVIRSTLEIATVPSCLLGISLRRWKGRILLGRVLCCFLRRLRRSRRSLSREVVSRVLKYTE